MYSVWFLDIGQFGGIIMVAGESGNDGEGLGWCSPLIMLVAGRQRGREVSCVLCRLKPTKIIPLVALKSRRKLVEEVAFVSWR